MSDQVIKIGVDFSHRTGLRHCSISDYSGELFYHMVLNESFKKALDGKAKLIVDLDGGRGYSPSFIDEAFGNLVFDFKLDVVKEHLILRTEKFKMWVDYVHQQTFPSWEKRRKEKEFPVKTAEHSEWWRTENDQLKKVSQ